MPSERFFDERAIPLFTVAYGFGLNAQHLPRANLLRDVLDDVEHADQAIVRVVYMLGTLS